MSDPDSSGFAGEARGVLQRAQVWVVKVGSSLLSGDSGGLNDERLQALAAQISRRHEAGAKVLLVSSGAVAAGTKRLGLPARPDTLAGLQAAAAVGQMGLAGAYERAFAAHDRQTAMVLLTHDDLSNRRRYLNARATLTTLLDLNVLPIINENDSVATDEIRFGDNDTLAAMVANLLGADVLVLLTDQPGMLDANPAQNPDARRIPLADPADRSLDALAGDGGVLGRGGMITKLRAARLAASAGAHTVIADGGLPDVLDRVAHGEDVGTLFTASGEPLVARKRWLAGQLRVKGSVVVDNGASRAIRARGVSLLPVGVRRVEGAFERGDLIAVVDESGQRIAQGLSNYSANDAASIVGVRTSELAEALGHVADAELIHCDNMALI